VFLLDLTRILEDGSDQYIKSFYVKWCKKYGFDPMIPLNPGTMWMISMAVLQAAKEQWGDRDVFPDTPVSKLGAEWGLKYAEIESQEYDDPPLSDVIEKMRHALAHFNVIINEVNDPSKISSFAELMQQSSFTLINDFEGKRFKITINYRDLSAFNAQVYTLISKHYRSQIGVN